MRLIPRATGVALTLTALVAASPRVAAAPIVAAHASRATADRHDPLAPPRAVAASLPAADGGPAGSARVAVDPVGGRLCVTSTGVRPGPAGALTGLVLSADVPNARWQLAGADALADGQPRCSAFAPLQARDLLAHPETYSLIVTGSGPDGPDGLPAVGDLTRGTLAAAAPAARPFPVGTRTDVVTDTSRATPGRGRVRGHPGRRLQVSYYYPGVSAGAGAPADPEGPFPLVLFAHGYDSTPQDYDRTLRAWAAAGYVVAAPLFPGSGRGLPGPATEADLTQQPADLRVVLDAAQGHTLDGSWLAGVADVTRVAVAGHSDGGSTAAAAGLLAGYTDRRYDAVIVMAGARFAGRLAARPLPLLVLSGDRDEYNSQRTFADVLAAGRGTRAWVQAVGGSHEGPFTAPSRQADVLRALEVDFLDRSLLGLDTRVAERVHAAAPSLTRLRAGAF